MTEVVEITQYNPDEVDCERVGSGIRCCSNLEICVDSTNRDGLDGSAVFTAMGTKCLALGFRLAKATARAPVPPLSIPAAAFAGCAVGATQGALTGSGIIIAEELLGQSIVEALKSKHGQPDNVGSFRFVPIGTPPESPTLGPDPRPI